jgi:uncharacterized protein (TIGR02246 family)
MKFLALMIIVGGFLMSAVSLADPVSTADAKAIRAVIDRQIDAWNRHDMEAFVADTTPDVDWINIVGVHWQGRDTLHRAMAVQHKAIFAHSRMLAPEMVQLRRIAPDVVIAVRDSRIEGAGLTSRGTPYPDGGNILTLVFVKTDTGWRICHGHNTPVNREAAAHDPAKAQ